MFKLWESSAFLSFYISIKSLNFRLLIWQQQNTSKNVILGSGITSIVLKWIGRLIHIQILSLVTSEWSFLKTHLNTLPVRLCFFCFFHYLHLALVGWSQMPGRVEWVRKQSSAATTFPEAHASVSLCYKSFRDTQKGHNTFLSLFSHPSILSFYYWMRSLWAPNLPLGMIKKRKEDAGDVRLTRQERTMKWVGKKEEEVVQFDSTKELSVSKQRS